MVSVPFQSAKYEKVQTKSARAVNSSTPHTTSTPPDRRTATVITTLLSNEPANPLYSLRISSPLSRCDSTQLTSLRITFQHKLDPLFMPTRSKVNHA
ncbi:unnamed protein product [Colias eurytheme]|nr:unnamed protein product [Colias eurytheme]